MYRSFAVAAAVLAFCVSGVCMAQTTPPRKPADKQPPKTTAGGAAAGAADPKFVTNDEKVSYGIGLEIGGNVKLNLQGMAGPMFKNVKLEAVMWGIRDGLMEEGVSRVGEAELEAARTDFQTRLEKIVKDLAAKNLKAAQATLASNKSKPGVTTTKSGLQYKVLKKGTGVKPKATDVVKVHYQGSRTDGTIFDGTDPKGEPANLIVADLIPGWKEALNLMKVGDKWQLHVPPELAYGEMGREGIEPNALLIFDLELVGIADQDELSPPGVDTGEEPAPKTGTKAASSASGAGTGRKPAAPR